MRLISVNVGRPRAVSYRDGTVTTGIYKEPVAGRTWLRRLNLDGDGQADLRVHGGEHKAVYALSVRALRLLVRELRRKDLGYGQFGENLTVEGLLEEQVHIGDVYRIGAALLQVSQPRSPCFKLGVRMGDAAFVARFAAPTTPASTCACWKRVGCRPAMPSRASSGPKTRSACATPFACATGRAEREMNMRVPRVSARLRQAGARRSRSG